MALLLAAIGNPGKSYQFNRHNIGFLALDAIAEKFSASPQKKFTHLYAKFNWQGQAVHCVWPQNYVNCSGQALKKFIDFFDIPLQNMLLIHDELDLPVGALKVKFAGGTAGHNGLKDIASHLGKDYWRLRIGIGHPGHPDRVSDYVLSNPPIKEMENIFIPLLGAITDKIELLIADNMLNAENSKNFMQEIASLSD